MYAVMPSTPPPRHADGTSQRDGQAVDQAVGDQDDVLGDRARVGGGEAADGGVACNDEMRRRQSEQLRMQQNNALRYYFYCGLRFVCLFAWNEA